MKTQTLDVELSPVDNRALANLCGALDANLRQIESALDVSIARRGAAFTVRGQPAQTQQAATALERFYAEAHAPLSIDDIQLGFGRTCAASPSAEATPHTADARRSADAAHAPRRSHGRTTNQILYLKHIQSTTSRSGTGPAGTRKTYLAVAGGRRAERDLVKRTSGAACGRGRRAWASSRRSAQKVDPYLRAALRRALRPDGFDKTARLFKRNTIEIAPLAYMRGRTLNHSFIILDEAQNTTPEQMKMFLTRIGFGTKAVITGDVTQIDLARGQKSGLIEARRVLATFAASPSPDSPPPMSCAIHWSRKSSAPMKSTLAANGSMPRAPAPAASGSVSPRSPAKS